MVHDDDGLTTAALLLGGGLAGYAVGHWLDRRDEPNAPAAAPTTMAAASPSPAAKAPLDEPVSSPSQVSERNGRAPRAARRYTREGRTILRDGVAVLFVERVDLGDHRFAISPHETDVLAQQIVERLNGARQRRQSPRRDGRKKDPWYRERWLAADKCGYRAWVFWAGDPLKEAAVGDAWAYLEKPSGEVVGKRRFRTKDEAYRYVMGVLKRALERAGKDCD